MLVVAYRNAPRPVAAVVALLAVTALTPPSDAITPVPGDATAHQVIRWETQRAPRAALLTLGLLNAAFETAAAPPVTPVPGDATAHQVVRWEVPTAPRAAVQAALRNVGLEPSSTAVVAQPDTAPQPLSLTVAAQFARRRAQAPWNYYAAFTIGEESPGEAPAPTPLPPVRWRPGRTPRAALLALYDNRALEPSSGPVAPPEPEAVSSRTAVRYNPGRSRRGAVQALYNNVAHEPSSSAPAVTPVP